MSLATPFPPGACDSHVHFYDGRYPVAAEAVLHPPDAGVADYRRFQARLGLERVVVVQPTTYGLDNRCQLEAMALLGGAARGVAVVDGSVLDDELAHLTALGVRGARFHMLAGGAVSWDALAPVAARVAEHGWHVQLQLDGRELAERLPALAALPVTLVVDHVGRFMPPVPVDHPSFAALRTLVERGRCWVKLSAPYESSATGPPGYGDVRALARALVRQAPERMVWASNWPHPGQASPPDAQLLVELLADWAGDPETMRRILVDNPAQLYGF